MFVVVVLCLLFLAVVQCDCAFLLVAFVCKLLGLDLEKIFWQTLCPNHWPFTSGNFRAGLPSCTGIGIKTLTIK